MLIVILVARYRADNEDKHLEYIESATDEEQAHRQDDVPLHNMQEEGFE